MSRSLNVPSSESLATERLLMRRPRLKDAPTLFAFLGDQEAMRYTQAHPSLRHTRRYLAAHACQHDRVGCGPWVVAAKHDGRIIGLGGLYDDPFDPGWGVEVGYYFAPAAWGQGYATELVQFCLRWATARQRWPRISAFAHPDNRASRHVLIKAGFREKRFVPEMDRLLYQYPAVAEEPTNSTLG